MTEPGQCRSCPSAIIWVEMVGTGKRNPLNPAPDADRGNIIVCAGAGGKRIGLHINHLSPESRDVAKAAGISLYLSHFATCPNAGQHRKQHPTREGRE